MRWFFFYYAISAVRGVIQESYTQRYLTANTKTFIFLQAEIDAGGCALNARVCVLYQSEDIITGNSFHRVLFIYDMR